MHIDDIGKQTGMEPYQVSAALVMLELEGRVRQKAGKMFELTTPATSGVLIGV
jgi:predicted Rossmann fold nucleotide-binding protein DprA/Smf involved in DNA uptake